ncbi:MAG: hypothetical protein AB1349_00920 [Elusimicrobiota bacterium]
MLIESASGFSGAEIEQCIVDGLYIAYNETRELETKDILKSIQETVPLSKIMEDDIQSLRKWAKSKARFASEFTEKQIKLGFHPGNK